MTEALPFKPVVRSPTDEEQLIKAQWLELWHQDRVQLLLEQPFTASLALHLELVPVIDSRLQTAATDGRKVFFNPQFLQSLSAGARVFVLAHEVWHCVAGHLPRTQGRNPHLWNLATDHEVNNLLLEDGLEMPDSAVYFPDLKGDSAEQVYDWLLNKADKSDRSQQCLDQHQMEISLEGLDDAQDLVVDADFSPGQFDAQISQEWQENLVAATQACRQYGQLSAGIKKWVKGRTQPQVRWQDLLRQFVQRCYGGSRQWSPPARRHLYRGLYLPSTRSQSLRICVALDTSGSTTREMPVFLSELTSLLTSFDRVELTLIQCDSEIQSIQVWREDQVASLDKTEIQGFGGTSLIPPFEEVASDKPDCLVYLTDGYGPAPEAAPDFPVLWVLTADGRQPVSWGQATHLQADEA
ncbi:Predicted metal-dependent peptidase [Marinospirillum celere]|uniref:Predicted metal-dependent peptidase n=1 Tax=Marinospirillum celere TaxID=1122252 RepID=A0A1I1EQS2_9GAMM|nr:VWA-like domain-containing protein [Marinospirillum celere]SFB87270.1 Predicted metal-dependent peptidase [Marinospirillum celere]